MLHLLGSSLLRIALGDGGDDAIVDDGDVDGDDGGNSYCINLLYFAPSGKPAPRQKTTFPLCSVSLTSAATATASTQTGDLANISSACLFFIQEKCAAGN